jgi:hypothetical protein
VFAFVADAAPVIVTAEQEKINEEIAGAEENSEG